VYILVGSETGVIHISSVIVPVLISTFTDYLFTMNRLFIRGIAVTALVFLIILVLSFIGNLRIFSAFDPVSQALGELEITDHVFSKLREDPVTDERIVIVNLSLDRRTMAQQVQMISAQKPKVIGIDTYFNCEGGFYDTLSCPQILDTLGNLMLSHAIREAGNVVLVSRLLQSDSLFQTENVDDYDSMEVSDPMFQNFARTGYANLPTNASYQEDVKVCKSVVPTMEVNGKQKLALSVAVAMVYDSQMTKAFLKRNKQEEIINFHGNISIDDIRVKNLRQRMENVTEFNALCYAIDWPAMMEGNYTEDLFKDKIVLMGFLGKRFGDPSWEDKFFTPLNTRIAGRANPDMFGVVVHANIISMILTGDFIDEIPEWLQIIIAVILCFLNALLFYKVDSRYPYLFDGLSVVLQIVQIILVSAMVVFCFNMFRYKLELSLAIGVLALVGPCYDIIKSGEATLLRRKKMSEFREETMEVDRLP
jgi:CHASE2 domain-containing sensor protein